MSSLFIYGPAGTGKTYLLRSIAHYLSKNNPALKTFYTDAGRLCVHLICSVTKRRVRNFRQFYHSLDVLLIDDIHFLKGKSSTQVELFFAFKPFYEAGKQIIISADRRPEEIFDAGNILSRAILRGKVSEIKPPGYKRRLDFLTQKAEGCGLRMPAGILRQIAKKPCLDFRRLEGTLAKLKLHQEIAGTMTE